MIFSCRFLKQRFFQCDPIKNNMAPLLHVKRATPCLLSEKIPFGAQFLSSVLTLAMILLLILIHTLIRRLQHFTGNITVGGTAGVTHADAHIDELRADLDRFLLYMVFQPVAYDAVYFLR